MGIAWLEKELQAGQRPSDEELVRSTTEELEIFYNAYPRPRFDLCSAAAALLDDVELWRKVIAAHSDRDYYHYKAQKRSGMDKSDLGAYPCFEVSVGHVDVTVTDLLKTIEPPLAEQIRATIQRFKSLPTA